MLKKLYWVVVLIIVIGGVGLVVHFGMKPRPVPIVTLSSFETPEQWAQELFAKLQTTIQSSKILVIGVDQRMPDHFSFWQTFLKISTEAGVKFDSMVVDHNLSVTGQFPGSTGLNLVEEIDMLANGLKGAEQRSERVVILVPTSHSSQMVHNNFVYHLKKRITTPVTSISLSSFPRSRVEEKGMQLACVVEGLEDAGTGMLGCLVMQIAREGYRRQLPSGKWSGVIEQVDPNDYLILLTKEP